MRIYFDQRFIDMGAIQLLHDESGRFAILTDPHCISEAEVIMAMPSFFKDKTIGMMPSLRWVQLLSAGYDGMDLGMFLKAGIVVTNAKDVFSIQIAEDVFAKIFYLDRHLRLYQEQMTSKTWKRHPVHHELHGSVAGIVGAGSIGMAIAKRMKAFGVTTIGYRTKPVETPYMDEIVVGQDGFADLLKRSDYVIGAIPLDKTTHHLFDREAFQMMKETALFVNIARGGIVDQEALIAALANKQIRGAALDVTDPEPLDPKSPLWQMENVLITPHVASESPHQTARLMALILTNTALYLENAPLRNIITNHD